MKIIFHKQGGFSPTASKSQKKHHRHSHVPSSHSLASTEAPSEPDVSSVEDEESSSSSPQHQQQQHRERRVVQFNEQANVYHDNTVFCQEDVASLWYSRFEFNRLRRETMQEAQAAVSAERELPESENTTAVLLRSYQRFCNVQTAEDLTAALTMMTDDDDSRWQLPIRFIGLDRWTMNRLLREKVERRQRILRQLQSLQRRYHHDDDDASSSLVRETAMRRVSRTISQPSRLYAHHVARLAAAAVRTRGRS